MIYGRIHKEIRKQIFEARTKFYAEYDNMDYFFFQRAMAGVKSRWSRRLEGFKRIEPHSPINLEATLHRAPKYM